MPDPLRGAAVTRALLLALVGTMIAVVCGGVAYSASDQLLSTADEPAHLDYAVQVWHGDLPEFEEGLVFRPPVKLPTRQWVSQHPPLYYLLAAPLAGPPADAGKWRDATVGVRIVSLVFGVLTVPALAWATSLAVRRRRALWAASAAALGSALTWVVIASGIAYNHIAGAFFGVVGLGVGLLVLRRGLTPGRLLAACAVASAGMATRSNFIVTLALMLGAVGLASLLHSTARPTVRVLQGLTNAGLVLLAVAVTSGWFYLRNIRLSGSWTGGHPDFAIAHLSRERRELLDVLTDPSFWAPYVDLLHHGPGLFSSWVGPLLLLGLALAAVTAVWAHRSLWSLAGGGLPGAAVVLVLVGQAVGTIAMQAAHVMSSGNSRPLYTLPSLLPMALLLAGGALAAPRLGGWLAAGAAGLEWALLADHIDLLRYLEVDAAPTGVPNEVMLMLMLGVAVGVAVQAVGLVRLGRLPAPPADAHDRRDPGRPPYRLADREVQEPAARAPSGRGQRRLDRSARA